MRYRQRAKLIERERERERDMAHRFHQDRPRKCDADRAYLRAERKRARRRDRQVIRETWDWDNYTHPLHKRDPYRWPSW